MSRKMQKNIIKHYEQKNLDKKVNIIETDASKYSDIDRDNIKSKFKDIVNEIAESLGIRKNNPYQRTI